MKTIEQHNIKCINCGDIADFSPPDNSEWFCCQDCYDEFYDLNDCQYFLSKDDLIVS